MHSNLRDISLDLSLWTPYKVVEPFRILNVPIDDLRQSCYELEQGGVLLSAGVFEYKGKKTHIAWGIKSEPHCSFHALAVPDDNWGRVVDGCPEYQILRREGRMVGFSIDGAVFAVGGYAASIGETIKEKIRQFAPLILFFALAILWASARTYFFADSAARTHGGTSAGGHLAHLWMLDFMGGFFLLFGGLKALRLRKFARAFASYDIIAGRFRFWGFVYPLIEIGLGVLYTVRLFLPAAYILTLVLMSVGCFGIFFQLRKKEKVVCACLGGFFDTPLTWVTFSENLLMAGMALAMLLY